MGFNLGGNVRAVSRIPSPSNRSSKSPMDPSRYSGRGIWDLTNLLQFAPYESGYCLLGVISSPRCMTHNSYNKALQTAFVKMLEMEFKGLDGIDDITADTIDISDNISTISYIGKTNQQSNGTVNMRFTEKSGSLITKYISTYLRIVKDPRTQVKTYDGYITSSNVSSIGPWQEVFNFLYIVTDSTCLRVEKAFLLLNAQPTTAAYNEMYNMERGNIEAKELSIPFNTFVVDGEVADNLAKSYVTKLVNLSDVTDPNKINLNSWNYDWSYSSGSQIKNINGVSVSG